MRNRTPVSMRFTQSMPFHGWLFTTGMTLTLMRWHPPYSVTTIFFGATDCCDCCDCCDSGCCKTSVLIASFMDGEGDIVARVLSIDGGNRDVSLDSAGLAVAVVSVGVC